MTISIMSRALIMFGISQMMCEELRAKSYQMYITVCCNACTREMLTLTCTEHTSTTSPVNKTQDDNYQHHVKGTDQVWAFIDNVCRIESYTAKNKQLFQPRFDYRSFMPLCSVSLNPRSPTGCFTFQAVMATFLEQLKQRMQRSKVQSSIKLAEVTKLKLGRLKLYSPNE